MIRLNCVVEGQTEQRFINEIVSPFVASKEIYCSTRCIQTRRKRGIKSSGGLSSYLKLKGDLQRWMKEDQQSDVFFTTMIDFYALPNSFPDYDVAIQNIDPFQAVSDLEHALREDMNHPRFIPYIQIHEFEALLFCDPSKFDTLFPNRANQINNLVSIAEQFQTPEHINQGQETAPSKRIIDQFPDYRSQKTLAGPNIIKDIGLDILRAKCDHFNNWISHIEALP